MAKKVLVTGGAGFIGSHIVDQLVARGISVTVLDDLSTGFTRNLDQVKNQIEFVKGSILDEPLVEKLAQGCSCVFHLAAVTSVPQSVEEPVFVHKINALGSLVVFEAARKAGARVVFSSSAAVYGDDPTLPKREDMATFPISPYGVQKLMGEHYLRNYNLLFGQEGFCLRYFNVFGPRQNPASHYSGVITIFINRALSGEPITIFGDGAQTRDFVFVSDVVQANLHAMDAPRADCQPLNVGTGSSVSLTQLANIIREAANSQSPIEYAAARAGDIVHSRCDPSKNATTTGFRAQVDIQTGLTETVRFYSQ
jgi:UDP-glucose 4-epimerase